MLACPPNDRYWRKADVGGRMQLTKADIQLATRIMRHPLGNGLSGL